jgi:hypothetical protein
MSRFAILFVAALALLSTGRAEQDVEHAKSQIGREVAIERHLADDEEFQLSSQTS